MDRFRQNAIRYLVTIISFFTMVSYLDAQSSLKVVGTAEYEMQALDNATVTLYKDGRAVETVTTSSRGEFRFELDINSEYVIHIEKDGLIGKKIAFNTELPGELEGKWTMEFAMGLFPNCDGVDASALDNPVDRIKYSTNKEDFISDEAYVRNMRGKIEKLLGDIDQCQSESYNNAMDEGERLMAEGNYDAAIQKFEEAQAIFPTDRTASKMIATAEKAAGASQKDDRAYQIAISEADRLFEAEEYEAAREMYNEALLAKPDNYAREKVAAINTLIREQGQAQQQQMAADRAYNTAIAQANRAFTSKDYEAAKKFYAQALLAKPDASFPQQKINEIEPLIAGQKQNQQAMQAEQKAYDEAIAMGQQAMQANNPAGAKEHFTRALMLKPQESYPKQMLDEANRTIEANKSAQLKASKAQLQQQIESALDEGDKLMDQKKYVGAAAAYQRALSLDPDDVYARRQADKANNLQLAAEAEKQRALEKSYADAMDNANKLLAAGSFQQAAAAYKQILQQKPGDAPALSKLQEAEQKLAAEQSKLANEQARRREYENHLAQANKLFDEKQYELARQTYQTASNLYPDQTYPRTKIQEIERIFTEQQKQQQFDQLITRADGLLNSKDYDAAKVVYQQALAMNATATYPRQKISEINGIQQQNAKLAVEQQQRDAQYQRTIQEADNLLRLTKLAEAKAAYQQAITLKPGEVYPKNQMTKIDGMLAEQLKKENDQKAIDQQYAGIVTRADGLFTARDYEQAKLAYQQALSIKAAESYPRTRISEIDGILQQQAQQAAAAQQQLEDQYKRAIQEADNLMRMNRYPDAKAAYQRALVVKAGEQYPQEQISRIDVLVAALLKKESEEKALDQQYTSLIAKADGQMVNKDFSSAKASYEQALALKSLELYPRQKIAEIDGILRQQEQLAARQRELDQQYTRLIQDADNLFNSSRLLEAKGTYQQAAGIKAGESYPAAQITKIDNLLAQQAQAESDRKAKELQYNQAIEQADREIKANNWQLAKAGYQKALSIKPAEAYPKSQIERIDAQLAAIEKEKQEKAAFEQQYNTLIASADRAYDNRDYPAAKVSYTDALKMKPGESYPQQRLNKIAEFERILAQQKKNQQTVAATTVTTTAKNNPPPQSKLAVLSFANDSERDKYLNELRSKYPEGVTLEIHTEKTKTTHRYVVIRGNEVREFRRVKFSWGGVEFTDNGIPTTGTYFDTQVKVRSGEFFQEFKY